MSQTIQEAAIGAALAPIGYEAYGQFTDFKNYQGNKMPEFSELSGKIPGAWGAAALAIVAAVGGKNFELHESYSSEGVARVCHEANRALCQILGDDSQKPWEEASIDQRESALKGVDFCRANPTAPADQNHVSWLEHKVAQGWVYGEVKDEVAKTHPCIVPYEQLPIGQRIKDHLFKAVVATLTAP
jgi:hypothetical protein